MEIGFPSKGKGTQDKGRGKGEGKPSQKGYGKSIGFWQERRVQRL